jgi:hypothetical protein
VEEIFVKTTDQPCWLNPKDLHIARALEEIGFHYCGNEKNFGSLDYLLGKVCGWELKTALGEVAIDAVKDEALYSKCLEVLDVDSEQEFKRVKATIKRASDEWASLQPIQLNLF